MLIVQMNHLNKHMNADGVIALWSMSHVFSCTSNLIWHSFANRLNVQEPLLDCQVPRLNLPLSSLSVSTAQLANDKNWTEAQRHAANR